eukprot:gene10651-21677_t
MRAGYAVAGTALLAAAWMLVVASSALHQRGRASARRGEGPRGLPPPQSAEHAADGAEVADGGTA